MSVRTLAGARWSCRSCGQCCHGMRLGPVEPEVIAAAQARGVEAHWPPAAGGWYTVERDPAGGLRAFLSKVDGHCVFLRPDNLCALHALWGAEAKPWFCRQYPFHLTDTPQGRVAIVRADCSGFHESFVDGEDVGTQASALDGGDLAVAAWAPEEVTLAGELRLPRARWEVIEQMILEELAAEADDPPGPEAAIEALRARIHTLAGLPEPARDPYQAFVARRAVLHGVHLVLTHTPVPPGVSAWERALAEDMAAAAARTRDRLASTDALDLPPALEARRYLHLLLRSDILGKRVFAWGSFAAGIGAWLVESAVSRLGHPDGEQDEEGPVSIDRLGRILPRWRRLTHNAAIHDLFRRAKPALEDAFLHVEP